MGLFDKVKELGAKGLEQAKAAVDTDKLQEQLTDTAKELGEDVKDYISEKATELVKDNKSDLVKNLSEKLASSKKEDK